MAESPTPPRTGPSFLRTFLVYGTGALVRRVAALLLFPVYTRFLTPEDYGVLSLTGAFGTLAHAILGMGIPTSIFRFYMREESERGRQEVLRACLNLVGLTLLPTLMLASLSRPVAARLLDDGDLWILVVLTLIANYGDILSKVPLAPIRARQQSALFVTLSLATLGATLALSVVFVVVVRWGVFGILLAQALVTGAWSLVLLGYLLRKGLPRAPRGLLGSLVRYGLPLVLAYLSQFFLSQFDRILLKMFEPLSAIGLYSVGYRLAEGITIATAVFSFTWVPFAFDEAKTEGGRRRMASVGSTWFALILLAAAGISLFARELLRLLAPPEYLPAVPVVPVVLIGLTLSAVFPITSMGLQLADRTKQLSYLSGLAAAANLALNLLWIPRYGILGAAWATAASHGLLFVATLAFSQRCFPLPISVVRWGAAIVLGLTVGGLGPAAQRLGPLPAVGAKLAALGLLSGAYVGLGLLDLDRVRRLARPRRAPGSGGP